MLMLQPARCILFAIISLLGAAPWSNARAAVEYPSQSAALQACMAAAGNHQNLYGRPASMPACTRAGTYRQFACYGPTANGAQTIGCSGQDPFYVWPLVSRSLQPVRADENLGPCDSCQGESAAFGDPINAGTGNKYEQKLEYSGNGMSPLSFGWTYNSLGASAIAVPSGDILGGLRKTTFSRAVTVNVAGDRAYVSRPEGRSIEFVKVGSLWVASPGERGRLTESAGAWTFVDTAGNREQFDAFGRLLDFQNRAGAKVFVHYDGTGKIDYATDSSGRKLDFGYDGNGRLQLLTVPDGTTLAFTYTSAGFLKDVTYADASVTSYRYDESGWDQGSLAGSLTGVLDETGLRYSSTNYDGSSKATATRLGTGVNLEWVTYQASTSVPGTMDLAVVTTADGAVRQQKFDVRNGRVGVIERTVECSGCDLQNTSYSLDSNGYLSVAVRGNNVDTYVHDSEGRQTEHREAAYSYTGEKRTTQTDWNTALDVPTERRVYDAGSALVAKSNWTYNAGGQVLTAVVVDSVTGASRTQTSTYCETANVAAGDCPREGLLISSDGPLTGAVDKVTYTYYPSDSPTCASSPATCPYRKGDVWFVTNAQGHMVENIKYDGAGRLLSTRDINGVVTDRQYHVRGWLSATFVRGPNDAVTTDDVITQLDYWPTGLIKRVTQPDGSYTSFTYDQAHRLTDVTDNAGNYIHYTLNSAGRRTKEETKDSAGILKRSMTRAFNLAGQVRSTTDSRSYSTGISYDTNSRYEVTTDALNRSTVGYFDALKRLTSTVQDTGGIKAETKFEYNALDQLTKVIDPKGLSTVYTYNALGDLTQLSSPDTGVTGYTYDAAGNRASQTDARGVTSTYTYDGLGRITGVAYPTTALNVGYVYDTTQVACDAGETYSIGRMTRMDDASGNTQYCYNRFGQMVRKVQTTNGIAFTVRYSWDKAGQLIGMVYPDGSEVDYTRNALGQISAMGITRPGQAREVLLNQVTYLPFGPTTGWTYGNGRVMTRSYDQDYRPTAILDASPGGLSLGFGYDAVGNLTKLGTATGVATPDVVYGYDALGRLTRTADGPTNVAIDTYTYDKTGNRLTHVTAAGTSAYTYPATSHRLGSVGGSARTYDEVGNSLTSGSREFDYSDANRMNRVKNSGNVAMNYSYNGRGEQVNRNLGSTVTYSVYDEAGHWMGNYNGNGDSIQQALWMDDLPIGLLSNDHQIYYVEADHLGSPRVVLELLRNAVVWSWDSRGEVFGASSPSEDVDGDARSFVLDMRFPGQLFDTASGLGYNLSRDYDYSIGRYVTSDRIGLNGGISTYGYAHQAPMEFADPDGRAVVTLPFPIAPPPPHPLLLAAAAGTAIGLSFNAGYEGVRGRGFGIDIYDWTHADPVFNEVNEGDGAQAPGVPTEEDGYECPKNWDGKKVRSPNGKGYGWPDKKGNVWVPTGPGQGAHGGPHWDVQKAGGGYINVYPGGKTRGGR